MTNTVSSTVNKLFGSPHWYNRIQTYSDPTIYLIHLVAMFIIWELFFHGLEIAANMYIITTTSNIPTNSVTIFSYLMEPHVLIPAGMLGVTILIALAVRDIIITAWQSVENNPIRDLTIQEKYTLIGLASGAVVGFISTSYFIEESPTIGFYTFELTLTFVTVLVASLYRRDLSLTGQITGE